MVLLVILCSNSCQQFCVVTSFASNFYSNSLHILKTPVMSCSNFGGVNSHASNREVTGGARRGHRCGRSRHGIEKNARKITSFASNLCSNLLHILGETSKVLKTFAWKPRSESGLTVFCVPSSFDSGTSSWSQGSQTGRGTGSVQKVWRPD